MVKQLAKGLKGIGPATAALLASCYDPDNIPFFSDELFRWMHWDGNHTDSHGNKTKLKKPGEGWSRQIGYTPKEWESMAVKCEHLKNRMAAIHRPVDCLEIEKVAYVLGKEETVIENDQQDTSVVDEEKQVQEDKDKIKFIDKPSQTNAPTGKKRKANTQASSENTRKRTRSKTTG